MMSDRSSEASPVKVQPQTQESTGSVVRAWSLVLLAVIAGGSVFLRGRRLIDNIIPVSADKDIPAEAQLNE